MTFPNMTRQRVVALKRGGVKSGLPNGLKLASPGASARDTRPAKGAGVAV